MSLITRCVIKRVRPQGKLSRRRFACLSLSRMGMA